MSLVALVKPSSKQNPLKVLSKRCLFRCQKITLNRYSFSTNIDPKHNQTKDYFDDYNKKYRVHIHKNIDEVNSFNPNDTKTIFKSFGTFSLMHSLFLFNLCSSQYLVNIMISFITSTNKKKESRIPGIDILRYFITTPIRFIILFMVKRQFFPLFTGGLEIDDVIDIANKYANNGIRLIIDNSTEEALDDETFDYNLKLKQKLVDVCNENLQSNVLFMPIKITALMQPSVLENMTNIINMNKNNDEFQIDRNPTYFLDEESKNELEKGLERLEVLCNYAKNANIGIWIDAEQYNRQPGLNYISRLLQKKINNDSNGKIWVFNTYQCYLMDSTEWIEFDVNHAKKHNYSIGVKLVRGAYIDSEPLEAKKENRPNPIHPNKEATDNNYNKNVSKILQLIANQNETNQNVGLAICTHNRESLINATSTMDELGLKRNTLNIYTAQLKGMVDNLTFGLGLSGFNALKLIPYGDFDDVWPYLMRRLQENQSILNATQHEKQAYWIEIKRRIFGRYFKK